MPSMDVCHPKVTEPFSRRMVATHMAPRWHSCNMELLEVMMSEDGILMA